MTILWFGIQFIFPYLHTIGTNHAYFSFISLEIDCGGCIVGATHPRQTISISAHTLVHIAHRRPRNYWVLISFFLPALTHIRNIRSCSSRSTSVPVGEAIASTLGIVIQWTDTSALCLTDTTLRGNPLHTISSGDIAVVAGGAGFRSHTVVGTDGPGWGASVTSTTIELISVRIKTFASWDE